MRARDGTLYDVRQIVGFEDLNGRIQICSIFICCVAIRIILLYQDVSLEPLGLSNRC